MPTPFPGMDPYLEARGLWEEVHTGLIVSLQQFLAPLVRPHYRVAVERRTYLEMLSQSDLAPQPHISEAGLLPVGKPDILVTAARSDVAADPHDYRGAVTLAEVPMPDEVVERFLEIRDPLTADVITVIEILSPTNKTDYTGRRQYEQKRLRILGSATHLVEIDLLRAGVPLPLRTHSSKTMAAAYRIMVSRSPSRPVVEMRAFDLDDLIPTFPVPLRSGEVEPVVPLNEILHDLYDRAGFDLAIDYSAPPPPPALTAEEQAWVSARIANR